MRKFFVMTSAYLVEGTFPYLSRHYFLDYFKLPDFLKHRFPVKHHPHISEITNLEDSSHTLANFEKSATAKLTNGAVCICRYISNLLHILKLCAAFCDMTYVTIYATSLRSITHTHDDVIKWKHFPRYCPFVRGIHRSSVNSPTKGSDAELWCFFDMYPNKRLSKQWRGWWFYTPLCPLWRHHNVRTFLRLALIRRRLILLKTISITKLVPG